MRRLGVPVALAILAMAALWILPVGPRGVGAPLGDRPKVTPPTPWKPKPKPEPWKPKPVTPPVTPRPTPSTRRSVLAFEETTLEGWRFDFTKVNARRRLVVYLFEPRARYAADATRAIERIHRARHEYNLAVVGVMAPPGFRPTSSATRRWASSAEMRAAAARHLKEHDATFPCVVDRGGALATRYLRAMSRLKSNLLPAFFAFPVGATGGKGSGLLSSFAEKSPEPSEEIYRGILGLFEIRPGGETDPLAGHYPKAPDVTLVDTAGKTHRLSDYAGNVVMVVFIMRKCPHCKDQLHFLEKMRAKHGEAARGTKPWFEILAVCTDASGSALRAFVAEQRYAFPVAGDADWKITTAFRFHGATPDTFVIGPDGTVRHRHKKHTLALDPVLQMEIEKLLGLEPKPLLGPSRNSGGRACRICHEKEHNDWAITRHACAWETLVRLGKDGDKDCIPCHVVAAYEPGGFLSEKHTPHLVDVQCESCHGGNGCQAFTGKKPEPIKAEVCTKCHDARHSPRFDFATMQPRVVHNRAEQLAKLPRAEREAALKKLCSGAGRQLFDPNVAYIGSEACGKCHPTELKALTKSVHARATEVLAKPAPDHWTVPPYKRGVVGLRKPECLRCHTTGFGKDGGFPAAIPASPLAHPMDKVSCESCHGPGKAHADDPKRPKAIAKLGGTCNECNILPICRQCHDDHNAPNFDYPAALKQARHDTGEAVTPEK